MVVNYLRKPNLRECREKNKTTGMLTFKRCFTRLLEEEIQAESRVFKEKQVEE